MHFVSVLVVTIALLNGMTKIVDAQETVPTEPTEATTAPTEATTAPTEATTAPTEATTAPTEATTAPTEATTAPTEATTAPTEATTAPTEATTAPTEATTAPTEATTAPTTATETTATTATETTATTATETTSTSTTSSASSTSTTSTTTTTAPPPAPPDTVLGRKRNAARQIHWFGAQSRAPSGAGWANENSGASVYGPDQASVCSGQLVPLYAYQRNDGVTRLSTQQLSLGRAWAPGYLLGYCAPSLGVCGANSQLRGYQKSGVAPRIADLMYTSKRRESQHIGGGYAYSGPVCYVWNSDASNVISS